MLRRIFIAIRVQRPKGLDLARDRLQLVDLDDESHDERDIARSRRHRRYTCAPDSFPISAVTPIATAPQNTTRMAPRRTGARPGRAAMAPSAASTTSELAVTSGEMTLRGASVA